MALTICGDVFACVVASKLRQDLPRRALLKCGIGEYSIMPSACTHNHLCKDALDLWGKVEDAWVTMSQIRDYRPAIIDAFMGRMGDYREHRKSLQFGGNCEIL